MKTIGVMARAPITGRCKTRLGRRIGDEAAASLYRAMLLDTLEALARVDARRVVMAAPEDDGVNVLGALAATIAGEWTILPQSGRDLGERLVDAMETIVGVEGVDGGVLVDSDSPTMPLDSLARGLRHLGGTHALLGPCVDGGYWAIGAPRADPRIFQSISWSTPEVCAQTRERLRVVGWEWSELEVAYDVDDADDVARLREDLRVDPSRAPRCARWLAEHAP
jgi:rSAM/selenodomain-associated transferase 1